MPTRSTLLISTLLLSGLSTVVFANSHKGTKSTVATGTYYGMRTSSDKDSSSKDLSSTDKKADTSPDLMKMTDLDSDDDGKQAKSPNSDTTKQVKKSDDASSKNDEDVVYGASSKDDEGDTYQASKPDASISKHASVQTPASTDESHMDSDAVDDKLARR